MTTIKDIVFKKRPKIGNRLDVEFIFDILPPHIGGSQLEIFLESFLIKNHYKMRVHRDTISCDAGIVIIPVSILSRNDIDYADEAFFTFKLMGLIGENI